MDGGSIVSGFLILGVAVFIYFIPTWIAWRKRNADSVIAINLFLGWTFIGWVIALAMAFQNDKPVIHQKAESKVDKLMKLKNLLDSGALTETEYNNEKQKILNQ